MSPSNSSPSKSPSRHWLDKAEGGAIVAAAIGAVAALVFRQFIFAIVPLIAAVGFNFTNRFRRTQQVRQDASISLDRTQQLRGDLQALQTSLRHLPTHQKVTNLEGTLARVSEAIVDLQQRQDGLSQTVEADREQIKEAFTILRRGLYRLNDHVNESVGRLQHQIESLQQNLPPGHSSPQIADIHRTIAQLQAAVETIGDPFNPHFAPIRDRIEQIGGQVDRLESQQSKILQPGMRRLTSAVKQLQKPKTGSGSLTVADDSESLSVDYWLKSIDRRLEAIFPYEYELIAGDRPDLLLAALEQVQQRLIIVSPWLRKTATNGVVERLEATLKRQVQVNIGWGHRTDIGREGNPNKSITLTSKGWRYHAERDKFQNYQLLPEILSLKKRYSHLSLKLLGVEEKVIVCDRAWAMMGGQHSLCYDASQIPADVGLYTTDPRIINGLIECYKEAARRRQRMRN